MVETSTKNLDVFVPQLEALLFIYGAPMSYAKAAKSLNISIKEAEKVAELLRDQLSESGRALMLLFHEGRMQLTTRPEFSQIIETIIKSDLKGPLSSSSLETLTIVAYTGPVTRAEVDYIRGVNSSFTLRSLLLRGLISRSQRDGNTYVYEVSAECLKYFGVASASELPDYAQYSDIMNRSVLENSEASEEVLSE